MKSVKKILLLLFLFFPVLMYAEELNVMSFNVRFYTPNDGINHWPYRKDRVIQILNNYDPDIMGLQEPFIWQIEDILEKMPDYSWLGYGPEDGNTRGEYEPVLYNAKKLQLLSAGQFWLSENHEDVSIGWDAQSERVCIWGKFVTLGEGHVFYFFNVHYDHIGVTARKESSKLVLQKIAELVGDQQIPVILAGDFNSGPGTEAIKTIKNTLKDSYEITLSPPVGSVGTFNDFNENHPLTSRIDYVFVNDLVTINSYTTINDRVDDLFPSDHFPVWVNVSLSARDQTDFFHEGDYTPIMHSQGTKPLHDFPSEINVLESIDENKAVVSVLERDSLVFISIVNSHFKDSMKLLMKGSPAVRRVKEDGSPASADFSRLTVLPVAPGEMVVFSWVKSDSLAFQPANSLRIYLPMDYDLDDYSGNGLHAQNSSSVPVSFSSDLSRGNVSSFLHSTSVQLNKTDSLRMTDGDFSCAFWIKCPPGVKETVVIGNKNYGIENEKGFTISLEEENSWSVDFSDGQGNSYRWLSSDHGGGSINDNEWHFVAVSCERNGNLDVYKDGLLMNGSVVMPGISLMPAQELGGTPLFFLKNNSLPDGTTCFIDDVRLWNRPLSQTDVNKVLRKDTTWKGPEVVFLSLDEDLKDCSGNSLDGKDNGGVPVIFQDDSERGRVAYFDGLSEVVLPDDDLLKFGKGDFSFSLWIKCPPAPFIPVIVSNKDWNVIGAERTIGFALYLNFSTLADKNLWSVNFSDGSPGIGGNKNYQTWNAGWHGESPSISDDKWHFVVVSFDRDSTMDIYLNGKLQPRSLLLTELTDNVHDEEKHFPITLFQNSTSSFYKDISAFLDEFRIWRRPVNAQEVESLFKNGLAKIVDDASRQPKYTSKSCDVIVYPNPATGTVNLLFNAKKAGMANIQLFNSTGMLVKELTHSSINGQNTVTFSVKDWRPGMYLVRVISDSAPETVRLVVE
ncbi:MAG: endonuclease/exonuclease/phosphatase family protein [Mariniphaga sp.]|nr:endonuclease/exonuclease/phosphatase family protein [Mariniphaga sp.]